MVQVREFSKKEQKRVTPEQSADLIKKARKEHDKLIKGMFEFIDAQGGWLEFGYRMFKGEPLQVIKLVHGEICELPMGIVKHLNNTKKKIRRFSAQNMGQVTEQVEKTPKIFETQSRVRFTPMDVL